MSDGRYFVVDQATGRKFCVEPIAGRNERTTDRSWVNGGTDTESVKNKSQVEGGSVHDEDSVITRANGYEHITTLPPGHSPNGYIEYLCRTGKKVGE